ncbi:MAG: hypothetical protein K2P94_18375 [Rhodospirillaceae bacterium]|nr:hypothetical protein [Rhodospirillaceae bacterium]
MAFLPQPARGGRSIAAGGFIRRMAKSALPEVQAPILKKVALKNAVREPNPVRQTELLASEAEA